MESLSPFLQDSLIPYLMPVYPGAPQRSTGPRSVEGKSVSRFNALQHGADAASPIIPGEDPAEYQQLANEYLQRFAPQTPDEQYHV